MQNNIVIMSLLCYKNGCEGVQLEISNCSKTIFRFACCRNNASPHQSLLQRFKSMKNSRIVKTKSPPGLKTKQAQNTSIKTSVSTFTQMVRSIRFTKNQRRLSSRQALARRELNGFSSHMMEDIGVAGDVSQNGDITCHYASFTNKPSSDRYHLMVCPLTVGSKTTDGYLHCPKESNDLKLKTIA